MQLGFSLCCSCIFRILLFLFVSFSLSVGSSLLGLVHRLLVAKGLMVECVDRSIQTDKALTAGKTTQSQEEKEQTKIFNSNAASIKEKIQELHKS